MPIFIRAFTLALLVCSSAAFARQQPQSPGAPAQSQPAVDEWVDEFGGDTLDESKWERFTFEGGGGGKSKVEEGQLRQRGMSGSRSGVRSRPMFTSDRFIVEATLSKVSAALPEPGQRGAPIGNAIITVLFDGSGRNRIEWLLTSEGTFEAWAIIDGRGERLDNRKLATKAANPTLGIVRRGDDFIFMLNGQPGLQKTIKNMPRAFHVMLYGYGSSENNWDSVRVVTAK
ncbi:MAG TPA: hypothetical protein VE262_06050 [Blastocatellia bacterium]|nr:hypothetical protein [Blastocatellia bacterium]